ncbi:alpha/beta fold hydrolase [Brachybacterium hainanense]|uniref:Alpha/beta fold hydrolase n=1 Tax=Brachybacterium hainanense TaxID=1541174 RepID=A0ABV6RE28_9MICO
MSGFFDAPVVLHVGGGPVRLFRGGPVGAPPLLLLHGAMLDTGQGVWRRVAPALAEAYDVHVIDLPRHGGSRPWKGVLDDERLGRLLEQLLDVLGLPRVGLLGLSMGAGLATSFALRRPDRVSALLAIAPGGIEERRPAQLTTWMMLRTPGLLRACSWILARFPGVVRRSMIGSLSAGERTPDLEQILGLAAQEARAKHVHGERALDDWQVEAYGPRRMRLNLLPLLPRLSVPTLWVRGGDDPLVADAVMREAAAVVPGSRLVTIPDAGHIVTYDRPEEVIALARGFLGAALGRGST